MKKFLLMLAGAGLAFGGTGQVMAGSIVYLAGDVDAFAPHADPAAPSAHFVNVAEAQGCRFQDFDLIANVNGGTSNALVGHTFTGLPRGIVGATLDIRVQAGLDRWVNSDALLLSFVDAETTEWLEATAYGRTLGRYGGAGPGTAIPGPDPGLLTTETWSTGNDKTFTLDLAALPLADGGTLNLIPELISHGFLDVAVGDETGVDYMRLTVTHTPEPSTFLLLAMGAIGLVTYAWRRRR